MATFNSGVLQLTGPVQVKRGTSAVLATSAYVPAAGELIAATDTGEIRIGDGTNTWAQLPSYDGTQIANDYEQEAAGKALDAVKGKDLNDRLALFEGITGIDCGEITAGGD